MQLIKIQTKYGDTFLNLENTMEVSIEDTEVYVEKVDGTVNRYYLDSKEQGARLNRLLTNSLASQSYNTFSGRVD